MARWFLLLTCPFLPGCLAFGYPSVTYTPAVSNLEEDVHAFKATWGDGGMSLIMTGGEWLEDSIDELPLCRGTLESQRQSYFAYFVGGIPVSFSKHLGWSVLLYRPGYEVIEVSSRWWGRHVLEPRIDKLAWKPATDLDAQVKALQELCPEPGRRIASERVRQFVAHEYERLAASPLATTPDQREALLARARTLR
jgi:hypothetical protein